jgi:hypothetical protein
MFAAADTLITLLIFAAIAIISSWWKKRQGDSESDPRGDGQGPAPPLPSRRNKPPPAQPTNWEEELRRLLEGEEAAPPSAPPPPPVAPSRPAPKPPPVPRRPVVVVREEGETEKGLAVELPKLAESARSFLRAKSLEHQVEEHLRQRAGLATSASAYARASQLEVKVAEHLRHVTEDAARSPVPHRERAAAPESAVVRAMLHDRRAARAAILAAVILGPPRSLET